MFFLFPLGQYINLFINGQRGGGGTSQLGYIINIVLFVLAGYLAWNCSALESTPIHILYTVLACLFYWNILIYYLVYRIIMNVPCY